MYLEIFLKQKQKLGKLTNHKVSSSRNVDWGFPNQSERLLLNDRFLNAFQEKAATF